MSALRERWVSTAAGLALVVALVLSPNWPLVAGLAALAAWASVYRWLDGVDERRVERVRQLEAERDALKAERDRALGEANVLRESMRKQQPVGPRF